MFPSIVISVGPVACRSLVLVAPACASLVLVAPPVLAASPVLADVVVNAKEQAEASKIPDRLTEAEAVPT